MSVLGLISAHCILWACSNTCGPVHRGIVKEMGLTGKITPDQVAKKWDNLKTKFKVRNQLLKVYAHIAFHAK